ncbi:hypothetical protein [Glutamicibacter arilaitensis]|uniref:Uncharacterized protein n=1 Tax=Glutamicibacter arilaitensis TaxID=256701 RepID=A0A4Y8TZU3_9MICC|nr:hypothetical protein [Glutamicibacter arilaitensis]TFH57302.1 hypothetical protein EXY26_09990 [Glutamicibacter arilaitensis]
MTAQPVEPTLDDRVEAVLEAFCTAYRSDFGKDSDSYHLCLKPVTQADLVNAIATNLGVIISDAKITEILSEVYELHQIDGRCLLFEGEEYDPGDAGYGYALSDREESHRRFIRCLIREQAEKGK